MRNKVSRTFVTRFAPNPTERFSYHWAASSRSSSAAAVKTTGSVIAATLLGRAPLHLPKNLPSMDPLPRRQVGGQVHTAWPRLVGRIRGRHPGYPEFLRPAASVQKG